MKVRLTIVTTSPTERIMSEEIFTSGTETEEVKKIILALKVPITTMIAVHDTKLGIGIAQKLLLDLNEPDENTRNEKFFSINTTLLPMETVKALIKAKERLKFVNKISHKADLLYSYH